MLLGLLTAAQDLTVRGRRNIRLLQLCPAPYLQSQQDWTMIIFSDHLCQHLDRWLIPSKALEIQSDPHSHRLHPSPEQFMPGSHAEGTNSQGLSTILQAYDTVGLDCPRASSLHEIWGLASAMALHRICSIQTIMQGAFGALPLSSRAIISRMRP